MFTRKNYLIALVPIILLGTFFIFSKATSAAYGDTSTYVSKIYAGDGGQATEAYLDFPNDVAFDSSGNIYIADTYNNVIRKKNKSGIITTYAGTGSYGLTNGASNVAEFAQPVGLTVDSSGNVFVADTYNNQIRKIDIYGNVSTHISSGLSMPEDVAAYGNYLYIADTNNNAIKRLNRTTGSVTTLTTNISTPRKMDISDNGNTLYVADQGNYRVVAINTSSGALAVIAGSGTKGYKEGTGTAAQFRAVYGVGFDAGTNSLYVTDEDAGHYGMIRKINLSTKTTTQIAYDSKMVGINAYSGVEVYGNYIYLAGNGTINRYNKNNVADNNVVAGAERFGNKDGANSVALLGRPYDLILTQNNEYFYLAENNKIRRINRETGEVSFVIGNSVDNYTFEAGTGTTARFSNIAGITANSAGDTLYVVDRWNNRIRGINVNAQSSFLVSGSGNYNVTSGGNGYQEGTKNVSKFDIPANIVISPDDEYLYVTDTGNNRIRKVRISDGQTWLIAGSGEAGFADGTGTNAKFNNPYGLDIDSTGQYLFVADRSNHRIRRVKISDGETVTVAGDGRNGYLDGLAGNAVLSYPVYVKYYANKVFFTEAGSHRVRVLELSGGVVKLVAGSGQKGYVNGARKSVEFNNIMGMEIDPINKYLYVCDSWNDMLRKIDIRGEAPYTDSAPYVSSVSPRSLKATSDTNYQAYLDVYGENFRHGSQTQFGEHQTTTYVKASNSLTVVIPLGQMSPGYYDVKVTNVDGQSDILSVGFAVSDSSGYIPSVFYTLESGDGFMAYSSVYQGGVKTAVGDIDGDGQMDIITGTSPGGGPHVRIFSSSGEVKGQFMAYAAAFRGGINIGVGDVDGDGRDEIVTAAGPGGGPHIRVFDNYGNLEAQFFAYALEFRRGVKIAVGDVTGDGIAEIVTGTGGPSAPHVRIFDGRGNLVDQFFAYPQHFRIGINVLVSDVNNDGIGEVITAPIYNGGPHVRIFDKSGNLQGQFFAYAENYRGGVNLAGGDVDGDGINEIITGTSDGKAPHVRILNMYGNLVGQFFAASQSARNGIYISSGDINNDGWDEIVTSEMGGAPEVVKFDYLGNVIQ